MRMQFILFLVITLASCQESVNLTYQAGIERCHQIKIDAGKNSMPRAHHMKGYSAPSFKMYSLNGDTITHQSILGNPTVINFWFIGCPPCEAEIPGFNILADKYKSKDVNFIAVGKNDPKYLEEFFKENPWNFTHINDPYSKIINDTFQIKWGYPTTFILDKTGVIQDAFSGGPTDSTATEVLLSKVEPVLDKLLK